MPSYPAKPYEVPYDDWFNINSKNLENNSITKERKQISTIHEFFYKEAEVKVGGSDNYMKTNLEKKSSTKSIISSIKNSDKNNLYAGKEKYSYSKIPKELKSIKKRSFKGNSFYKNSSNKNKYNIKAYLLGLKSVFIKIFKRK
tara:strand:+ start:15 stop:443 length:429 start_codon:yes stop_codon:yes gene_type:complete